MKRAALCAEQWRRVVRRVAGVEPVLSPPVSFSAFDPGFLEGSDFVYIKLHGKPKEPYWYNADWETVCNAYQIAAADLRGAVVVVGACHVPNSPMLDALKSTGARAVIYGDGENYSIPGRVGGADRLALYVRYGLTFGMSPLFAFWFARMRFKFKPRNKVTLDTLNFEILEIKQ